MTSTISYRIGEVPGEAELEALYRSVGWQESEPAENLQRALKQSDWVATAWHDDALVGLARVLTDGVMVAYFQELLVHPDYQHQGVGKELLDRYDREFENFRHQIAVVPLEWARHKLEKRGFRSEPDAMSRMRPLGTWTSNGIRGE